MGEAIAMVVASAIVGVVGWQSGGVRLALGVATIAPFWFAVGGSGRLVAKRPQLWSAIGIAALAIAASPATYTRAVTSALPTVATVAVALAPWIMRAPWSRSAARNLATVGAPEGFYAGPNEIFARKRVLDAHGRVREDLAATLEFWLRAAMHEDGAGGNAAWSVYGVIMAETLLVWSAFTIPYVALRELQEPALKAFDARNGGAMPWLLVASIALTPIMQWPRAKGPILPTRAFRKMGYFFAYVAASSALAVQVLHYAALQRVYRRADLVAPLP